MARRGGSLLRRLLKALEEDGHQVSAIQTSGPGSATMLAIRSIQEGADLILAAGGDGTINEIMNGMVPSTVPLGVIPAGTANVLATELKLGNRILKIARGVKEWEPRRVPVGLLSSDGEAHSRYFLLMAGVGFDAHVVYHLDLGLKAKLGKMAYWVASLQELSRELDEFDVEVEGARFRCSFALASKARSYAGQLEVTRKAGLFQDQFEIVLFEGKSPFRFPVYLAGVLVDQLENLSGVSILRLPKVRFVPPPGSSVYVQIDGEYGGQLPATVEMVPDALTLLVPPD